MVADVQQDWGVTYGEPGSAMVELDGIGYFLASDGIHGLELWRTDFTEKDTWMVRDICPGDCGGLDSPVIEPIDGLLYFFADAGDGWGLWRSDGSQEGTQRVLAIRQDRKSGSCNCGFAALEGEFLFVADDGTHGCELWRSDGTAAGTALLYDTVPGENLRHEGPQRLRRLDTDTAVFITPYAVWRSDGTPEGTMALLSIEVDTPAVSGIFEIARDVSALGIYYLQADDGIHGTEPWRTDGTVEGTQLLVDSAVGGDDSQPRFDLIEFAGDVYFLAGGAQHWSIWRTDGTPDNTQPFFGVETGRTQQVKGLLGVASDRLFFAAGDAATGWELWSTDGTPAGTELVLDIAPGPAPSLTYTRPEWVTNLEGRLIFPADDVDHGRELWASDGTAAGTFLLADAFVGDESGIKLSFSPSLPRRIGTRVAYFAYDSEGPLAWNLWTTDGTPSNTQTFLGLDLQTPSFPVQYGRRDAKIGAMGRRALFAPRLQTNPGPWSAGGGVPAAPLEILPPDEPVSSLGSQPLSTLGDRALFRVDRPNIGLPSLWASDGTVAGSEQLLEGIDGLQFQVDQRVVGALRAVQGGFYWTDGTPRGTEVAPGPGSVRSVAAAGDHLFLASEVSLWSTHFLVSDVTLLTPGIRVASNFLAAVEKDGGSLALFFVEEDSEVRLWRSNGTTAGTEELYPVAPGPQHPNTLANSGDGKGMVGFGEQILFAGDNSVNGPELWISDGTKQGTHLVIDLVKGSPGSLPDHLVATPSAVYFAAQTPEHGRELWRTDGTAQGTVLVADLAPGPESSLPRWLTVVGDTLYFVASDPLNGRELRAIDLATGELHLVADVLPGPASSSPSSLAPGDGLLWFTATDGVHGHELWRLEIDGLLVDGFESGDTSAWE
ncbi:MAG: hypothetical protein K8J08_01705 [Thermoanaerobaculia bacterium]|nr:hypothetical protein [Thermoanaerobaculia bacterium]